jgi:hypothetical protein
MSAETDIQFEVWQDGDVVATADSLSDAQHFMVIYGQDGPVEAKTAITTRFPGFNKVSAAASPVVPVGWRDITTAPRDGRVVLVFSAARCVWSVVSAQWRQDWPNGGWDTISKHTTPIVPTHWMPLPPTPTDTGRE